MSQSNTSGGLPNEVPLRRSMRLINISTISEPIVSKTSVQVAKVLGKETKTKRCLSTEKSSILKQAEVTADKSSNLDAVESSQSQKENSKNIDDTTIDCIRGDSSSVEVVKEMPTKVPSVNDILKEECSERKTDFDKKDSGKEQYEDGKSVIEVIDNKQVSPNSNSGDENFTEKIIVGNLKKKLLNAMNFKNESLKPGLETSSKKNGEVKEPMNISSVIEFKNHNLVTPSADEYIATNPELPETHHLVTPSADEYIVTSPELPETIIINAKQSNSDHADCVTTLKEDIVHQDPQIDDESLGCENEKNSSDNIQKKENSIDSKIDELLLNTYISSDESDDDHDSFVYSQAEEGEEDTPSEGSNDIVEIGEEINTESEISADEAYEKDSFIDDEENYQLLSGDEYDLSLDNSKKRSRIIQLSSGSDDEVIYISRSKKKEQKKRKKSRIIKFEDSSDENTVENTSSFDQIDIEQDQKICDLKSEDQLQSVNSPGTDMEYMDGNKTSASVTSPPVVGGVNNKECINKKIVIIENIRLPNAFNKHLDGSDKEINSFSSPITNTSELANINKTLEVDQIYCHETEPQHPMVDNIVNGKETIDTGNIEIPERNMVRKKKRDKKRKNLKIINSTDDSKLLVHPNNIKENNDRIKKLQRPFNNNGISVQENKDSGIFSTLYNVEEETAVKCKMEKKRNRKRKRIDYNLANEPALAKKRRNQLSSKHFSSPDNINLNIIDEALLYEQRIPFVETNLVVAKLELKNVSVKPTGETQTGKKKQNNIKCNRTEKSFHIKDFKNLMLYDKSRVKRIEVNKLLKKKKC